MEGGESGNHEEGSRKRVKKDNDNVGGKYGL